jgi:Ca-activated chloride channel family protein
VPVRFGAGGTPNGAAMPTIWAREKIEALQAQDYMGEQMGNGNKNITDQIIAVALEYRLMSRWTSFVAVEQRVVNIGGKQRLVDVPVEMPEGVSHEGIFGEEANDGVLYERAAQQRLGLMSTARPYAGAASVGGTQAAVKSRSANTAMPAPAIPGPQGVPGPVGPMGAPPPAVSQSSPKMPLPSLPAVVDQLEKRVEDDASYDEEVARGTDVGQKRLAAMTPQQRQKMLSHSKLAPGFIGLAAKVKSAGKAGNLNQKGLPIVTKGRVEVQIWLNSLPPDGLAKLKAAGFELAATLTKGKLLLGTVSVDKLDELIALSFVRRVEPPKYK